MPRRQAVFCFKEFLIHFKLLLIWIYEIKRFSQIQNNMYFEKQITLVITWMLIQFACL